MESERTAYRNDDVCVKVSTQDGKKFASRCRITEGCGRMVGAHGQQGRVQQDEVGYRYLYAGAQRGAINAAEGSGL